MLEFWDRHKADIGLAVLVIYALSLGVATADQVFDLGIFPTKLDRMIGDSIERFASQDQRDREAAFNEILQYGEFAVPQLVAALDDAKRSGLAIECLKQITDQKISDPKRWKDWYRQHKEDY